MRTRGALLVFAGFIAGSLVFSIPSIDRIVGDVGHYLFSGAVERGPLPQGDVSVSWADAEGLLRQGHVRSVMIPHSGRITMKLDNGILIDTQEPYSGATSTALQTAPNRRWMNVAVQ